MHTLTDGALLVICTLVGISYMRGMAKKKRIEEAYTPHDDNQMADGRWVSKKMLKAKKLLGTKGIPLGYVWEETDSFLYGKKVKVLKAGAAIADDSDQHVVIVAPAGAGKHIFLQTPAYLSNDHQSLFLLDTKGEGTFVSIPHRSGLGPVHILAPFSEAKDLPKGYKKATYNPIERLCDGSIPAIEVPSLCTKLAHTLVPEEPGAEGRFFCSGARNLVSSTILAIVKFGLPAEKNLPSIARIITYGFADFCRRMAACPDAEIAGCFRAYLEQHESDNRAFKDVHYTATTGLAFLLDPGVTEMTTGKSSFKVSDLRRRTSTVYAIMPLAQLESSGPLSRLLVGCFISELTRIDAPKNRKVLLMCDEAFQYGNLQAIPNTYAAGRGFGIRMVTIWQDLSQLSVYGKAGESLLANAGVRIFISPQDNQTAEYVSRQCGTYTVVPRGKSAHIDSRGEPQVSDSMNPQTRPLLHAFEALQLPGDIALVWIRGVPGPIRTKLVPYYKDLRFRFKAGKNPYHA